MFVNLRDGKIAANNYSPTILTTFGNHFCYIMEPKIIGYTRGSSSSWRDITYHLKDDANTIHCHQGRAGNTTQYVMDKVGRVRILTPRECFRLMDVPEEAIDKIQAAGIPEAQQYVLAGNSIVVSVLAEVFRKLLLDDEPEEGDQLQLF